MLLDALSLFIAKWSENFLISYRNHKITIVNTMSENRNSSSPLILDPTLIDQYKVFVAKRFVVLSMLLSILVAFAVGRTARLMILVDPRSPEISVGASVASAVEMSLPPVVTLPDPVLKAGKTAPPTQYLSKTFDTTLSASTQSRWIVVEEAKQQQYDSPSNLNEECIAPTESSPELNVSNDDQSLDGDIHLKEGLEVHLPAGQHLLMDIENVDREFLNSELRLANAMLELVDTSGLTLLSYHCHKFRPRGVSCAGVLLESHVSFHTWPAEGVITLDLYTCGPNSLLPLVPLVEKLFAVPKKGGSQPEVVWAHKTRGFHDDLEQNYALITDMQTFPEGRMTDFKQKVIKRPL
jgi:S-adenosylmethionine decarboxylase proenzyme